jgi:hypothetical protein
MIGGRSQCLDARDLGLDCHPRLFATTDAETHSSVDPEDLLTCLACPLRDFGYWAIRNVIMNKIGARLDRQVSRIFVRDQFPIGWRVTPASTAKSRTAATSTPSQAAIW